MGGKRDPPASTGWAGRAASLPTRAKAPGEVRARARKGRVAGPLHFCLFCPPRSVRWFAWGTGQASLVDGEGRGHGAVVQGIAYAQVLFAPGTRSSHPWDLYAPTCVASTGASDRASRDEQPDVPTGNEFKSSCLGGSYLHDFPVMTAGERLRDGRGLLRN